MRSRRNLLPVFSFFFILAVVIFLFSGTSTGKHVAGFFEQQLLPLQKTLFHSFGYRSNQATPETRLHMENITLQTQLAKQEEVKKENNALRDQFKMTTPAPKQLLPAQIIGGKTDEIILDQGSVNGVKVGSVLIVNDNLVGRIVKVSAYRAIGELLTKSGTTFTVKTAKTAALGIMQGKGEGKLVLLNVVLADKLESNDLVMTKGDIDQSGKGFPPDLVVGKIIAVNKKASNLFQSAEVEPLVAFGKMETVFILTE
jgi:rod shape-determining protein MreC